MTKPTPADEARDLRALLEMVLVAITLPSDTPDHDRRILERVASTRTALESALQEDPRDLGWNIDFLHGKLTAEQAEADRRRAGGGR
ncbi:hypothetical protein [Streptomyces sp. NPDC000888]